MKLKSRDNDMCKTWIKCYIRSSASHLVHSALVQAVMHIYHTDKNHWRLCCSPSIQEMSLPQMRSRRLWQTSAAAHKPFPQQHHTHMKKQHICRHKKNKQVNVQFLHLYSPRLQNWIIAHLLLSLALFKHRVFFIRQLLRTCLRMCQFVLYEDLKRYRRSIFSVPYFEQLWYLYTLYTYTMLVFSHALPRVGQLMTDAKNGSPPTHRVGSWGSC